MEVLRIFLMIIIPIIAIIWIYKIIFDKKDKDDKNNKGGGIASGGANMGAIYGASAIIFR